MTDPAAPTPDAGDPAAPKRRTALFVLPVVAFVCGTEDDPQRLSEQEATLRQAGALLVSSNAQAARVAALIIAGS